ncbi:MAG: orotidine-5'-phosphate decarboxylase [Bradymonadia bacterium]
MSNLCLALDVPTLEEAEALVQRTASVFGVYKVGLELFCAHGWSGVERVRAAGAPAIFLDLKLHDIPRTVAKSIARMEGKGVDFLTIHLAGGRAMLEASQQQAERVGVRLLGVSVLTSLDGSDLETLGLSSDIEKNVASRCKLAAETGLFGVVSSPQEATMIKRDVSTELFCVTPGIRFEEDRVGDQKRIMTPRLAIEQGADMLVIGRSVTQTTDMNRALARLEAVKS